MRRLWIIILCGILTILLSACSRGNNGAEGVTISNEENQVSEKINEVDTEISNPWITVNTIEAAREMVKIDFKVPEKLPEGYVQGEIRVFDNRLVEIIYINGEETVNYRVCEIFDDENNISGNRNEYSTVTETTIKDTQVIMYGEGEIVNCVDWENDRCFYSAYSETGMTEEEIRDLVESVQEDDREIS